jgi:uncharacterized protein (DUF983 family)
MFCPSCGDAVVSGLKFCNHCGAQLSAAGAQGNSKEISPGILIAAMSVVFIFGLFAISLLVLILTNGVHLASGQVMGFAGLSLLMLAALEAVFVTLLFRRHTHTNETNPPHQLHPHTTNALPDTAEHIPSVTEHTTRAFDYVPRKQR